LGSAPHRDLAVCSCSKRGTERFRDQLLALKMVLCGPSIFRERNPCPACKEDIELQNKIEELQNRRTNLRTKMNAYHDSFVLDLSPEVASYIFLLFMRDTDINEANQHGCSPTSFLFGAVCEGWQLAGQLLNSG